MKQFPSLIIFILSILISISTYCKPIIRIENDTFKTKVNISSKIEYKINDEKLYSPEDFILNDKDSINIGYTHRNIWFRLTLLNNTNKEVDKVIHFTSGLFNINKVYETKNGKLVNFQDQSTRPYKLFNAIETKLQPHEKKTLIVFQKTIHRIDTEVYVSDRTSFVKKEFSHIILNTIYMGIILALLVYNLILFLLMKDKEYLIYTLFLASMGFTVLSLTGFLQNIILPTGAGNYLGLYSSSAALFTYLFAHKLLDFERINKRFFKILLYFFMTLSSLNIILVSLPFLEDIRPYVGFPIDTNILLTCIVVLVTSIYLNIKMPSSESKVYLLSWLILYISAFAYFASVYGFISFNFYTQHSILFGNIIETFTLSIALGLKINRIKKENEINQLKNQDQQKYIRLLRVLSHDIANSLFIISGYASRYMRRGIVNEEKAWPKINNACEHIKNILDNVKSEQALLKQDPKLEAFPLEKLLDNIRDVFTHQCEAKNIKLEFDVEDSNIILHSNPTVLTHQVIGNVISNAIKFTPENGIIKIITKTQGERFIFKIKDNGIGMTKEKLQKIQESIDTGVSYGTNGEKGSGFGYFIIRSYSTLLNIDLNIESNSNGTTITFSIPILS